MTAVRPLPDWIAPEYPFAPHRRATPAGAQMSYVDEGGAGTEAVLMLHGNPTWSYYYRHLVRALAPSIRCVVPDHIGMGASEKPAGYDYTLAATLDTAAQTVTGELTLRYTNRSPDTLRFMWLQVEQNAFRSKSLNSFIFPEASRFGARGFDGGYTFSKLDQLIAPAGRPPTTRSRR